MGEQEPEPKAEEKQKMHAVSLFDEVRKAIYNKYILLSQLHDTLLLDSAQGVTQADKMKLARFRAALISLYIDVRPKMKYMNEKDRFDGLDQYLPIQQHAAKKLDLMTFEEASRYFLELRNFLEKNGITRYEVESLDPTDPIAFLDPLKYRKFK